MNRYRMVALQYGWGCTVGCSFAECAILLTPDSSHMQADFSCRNSFTATPLTGSCSVLQAGGMTAEARRLTLLAALTLPLRACRDDLPPSAKQRLSAPAHIILNALKWKRKDAECMAILHEAAPALLQCCRQLQVWAQPHKSHMIMSHLR